MVTLADVAATETEVTEGAACGLLVPGCGTNAVTEFDGLDAAEVPCWLVAVLVNA